MNFNPFNTFVGYLGTTDDIVGNIWYLWHFQRSLMAGAHNLFYTTLMNYPRGISLEFDILFFDSIASLPVQLCCGPVAAYNFVVFYSYVLTFIGMYLFLSLLVKNKTSAVIGALAFTFSAFRIIKTLVGHVDLLGTEWIGFFLYFAYQAFFYRKKAGDVFGMAVMFVLQAYTDYRTLILFAFIGAAVGARFGIDYWQRKRIGEYLGKISMFLVIFFIGILPFLYLHRFVGQMGNQVNLEDILRVAQSTAPSLVSYFIPWKKQVMSLGWLSIALCIFYLFFPGKRDKNEKKELVFFGIIFLFFVLLTFGLNFKIDNNIVLEVPFLPFSFFHHIPILRLFHSPARFIFCVQVAWTVILTFAVSRFLKSIGNRSIRVIIVVILACGVIFQNTFFIPSSFEKFETDKLTEKIRKGPAGSVLPIPFFYIDTYRTTNNLDYRFAMLKQIIHKKPLVSLFVSYMGEDVYQWYKSQPLFRRIVDCQDSHICRPFNRKEAAEFIKKFGLKYVFIYDNYKNSYKHMIPFIRSSFPDSTYFPDGQNSLFILK